MMSVPSHFPFPLHPLELTLSLHPKMPMAFMSPHFLASRNSNAHGVESATTINHAQYQNQTAQGVLPQDIMIIQIV